MKELNFTKNYKIKSLGIQNIDVFDIEVKDNHNFFANDILVHNSLYINLGKFIKLNKMDKFYDLTLEEKVEYIEEISKILSKHINDNSKSVTQNQHYNSYVDDFNIIFEPEKVALTGFFTTKKRYATWTLKDDGKWKDAMSITGLEVIRSDSPEIVKPMIIKILEMILKKEPEENIKTTIFDYKKQLLSVTPDEIAENKGINQLNKYKGENYSWKKGTPHQIKGVINLEFFLNEFNLNEKYEIPQEGNKAKIVYLQKNKYNRESLSFYKWPKELEKYGIQVDYNKMIENNFLKKIKNYLKYLEKIYLLNPPSLF